MGVVVCEDAGHAQPIAATMKEVLLARIIRGFAPPFCGNQRPADCFPDG
jgi:hypothetical protein